MIPKKFKKICAACNGVGKETNKEHYWPEWLIELTGTNRTTVRFTAEKRINPKRLTVPLCKDCNSEFGRVLESPAAKLMKGIEQGEGMSDNEAELLIRWLWKLAGLHWVYLHPVDQYPGGSLSERVLNPIDDLRPRLTLAVSLVDSIDPAYGDAPMGLDSWNESCTIFAAGVFSKVAAMVLLTEFANDVPHEFSQYPMSAHYAADRDAKLFYPKVGFQTCTDAVYVTVLAGRELSYMHDLWARNLGSIG